MSTLLDIPRELREEIFHCIAQPEIVYTSSATADHTPRPHARTTEETYVDTRIYLPTRPSANILATCKQLRQESLEYHSHLLNSSTLKQKEWIQPESTNNTGTTVAASRDIEEAAEEARYDGSTVRLTIEVQRGCRGAFGYYVPTREELSPRFYALLPFMQTVRRLNVIVWPGFDWWNGPPQASPLEQWRERKALLKRIAAYQVGCTEQPSKAETIGKSAPATKMDAVSVAIGKILDKLPAVEELNLTVSVATGDLFRWDLPDVKWEKIQPWLDGPITRSGGLQLRKVSRTLTSVWQKPNEDTANHQPFYVQNETRSDTPNSKWLVERQGGLRAVSGANSGCPDAPTD